MVFITEIIPNLFLVPKCFAFGIPRISLISYAYGGIISSSLWLLENSAKKLQCAYSDPTVPFRVFRLFAFEVLASLQLTNITALRL